MRSSGREPVRMALPWRHCQLRGALGGRAVAADARASVGRDERARRSRGLRLRARREKKAAFTLGENPSQLERSDREERDGSSSASKDKERESKTRAESYVTKEANASSPEGTTLRRLLAKETLARKSHPRPSHSASPHTPHPTPPRPSRPLAR